MLPAMMELCNVSKSRGRDSSTENRGCESKGNCEVRQGGQHITSKIRLKRWVYVADVGVQEL
jgi:hypothetical protein